MDAPASHIATCAILPLQRQILTALFLVFILVPLATIRPAAVAKESHKTCKEIQILQGVQDARTRAGKIFSYPISPFAFQGNITHYKVTLASGSALPKWLEYNPNTSTLQGLPMLQESGEYHLTVVAYGEACGLNIPTADVTFTLLVQDSVFIHEKEEGPKKKTMDDVICSGGMCTREISVTFAGIIIHHPANSLATQERLYLICTMAEYLHLDPSLLTLTPLEDSFNKYLWNLTVLAEDIRYISTVKSHFVGLYWPVGFGVFAMLYELVQVLQHNVESNNLSQLLGYKIAGWRILKKEDIATKHTGKRHRRQLMATPRPALRPVKTADFTILSGTLLHTKSVARPSESSVFLYEVTRTIVPTNTDNFLHSVSQKDLGTSDKQTFMDVQTKTPTSSIFQDLSSAFLELSPSLMTASTELENVASRTPPISEQLPSQVPQKDMYSAPKKSEPKHHFIFSHLNLSLPTSKTQFSGPIHLIMDTYVLTPSKRIPLTHLSKETVISPVYRPLITASGLLSGERISTAKLPVPLISALMNQTASTGSEFSRVVMSLLLSDSSFQNQDLFSKYKYDSELYLSFAQIDQSPFTEECSSPLTTTHTEVSSWNINTNVLGITSTSDSSAISSVSIHKLGLPPDARVTVQLYYSDNTPGLAMYSTQEFSMSLSAQFLEFEILSRTSSIPAKFPLLPLSMSVELTVSGGLSNTLSVEELLSERKQVSPEIFMNYEHISESFKPVPQTYGHLFTKDEISAFTAARMDTPLWNKQSQLIFVTTSSAIVLSSRFLGEDSLSHEMSFSLEWYSSNAVLLSWLECAGIPKSCLSTKDVDFYDSSAVKTPVVHPDSIHLDMSDLSLNSSFGTKAPFQISREFTSELMATSAITSHKEISVQTRFYHTSTYQGVQGQINTSPRIVNAVKWITATIGHKFSFSIPPDTFYDQEDGNTTQLTLGINPADGSPSGQESWLQFNLHYQTMHGYPLDSDLQYSPQDFFLFATDSGGLKTSDTLTIELLRPSIIPCHIYTVRTKNSYHSFLRNRQRVSLFFEKLSKYLSMASPGNLTLLRLRPGSTVVTWYNSHFCTRTNRCARDEIQRTLIKLGVPGGNVNPDFVEAMLPDYKIDQIEDFAYGGICSSFAKPLNESLTTNRTLATFQDSHPWLRNIIPALLISLGTAFMVILIIIFHYCKYLKKVSGSQSICFNERPCFSYVDLEMSMLKSRKPPIFEQEVPRAVQSWLSVPRPSQQHLFRPNRRLVASRLPPPPKYRLPPSYEIELSQTCHDHRNSYQS
ncbi:dystroglycan 1-like isoform X2 [Hemicordylus capensis]|nr:dystroglycan 1-like isoform X2 [Hemicordylus capensis]